MFDHTIAESRIDITLDEIAPRGFGFCQKCSWDWELHDVEVPAYVLTLSFSGLDLLYCFHMTDQELSSFLKAEFLLSSSQVFVN